MLRATKIVLVILVLGSLLFVSSVTISGDTTHASISKDASTHSVKIGITAEAIITR